MMCVMTLEFKMKILYVVLFVMILSGCTTSMVHQSDRTYVPATFVEANAPRVQRSLAVTVCPLGTQESAVMSGYVRHNAELDTGRRTDRRNGYNRYNRYERRNPVRIQQAVGGQKDFACIRVPEEKR